MTETVLKNAQLVLENEIVQGSICIDDTGIRAIDTGPVRTGGIDCEGDFVIPGLVELHTDNIERHFLPRPSAFWPNHLAAVMAHDAEVASAGVTTVFDAVSIGDYDGSNTPRRQLFARMVQGIAHAMEQGLCRIEHRLHFRCELSDPGLIETLAPLVKSHKVALASLMDHTPGQRQWRDTTVLKQYMGRHGLSEQQIEESLAKRIARGNEHSAANWTAVLELFAGQEVVLATHDDTTVDDIEHSADAGIRISEFPCSLEAAQHAHQRGMKTIGGAPNIVRGGSHSGNVAIMDLARENVLDALSSDYVPTSLLQAVFMLSRELDRPLYETIKLVTLNTASMVGLTDRGSLAVGKRSDVVRISPVQETPIIREVYAQGRRVS
ncbi:MAG: alpha-D-ribose 1-methylphosphonate 5-triphosphate diphosphatase [Alphaproteobacteria bacterium]